jgi:hypothetical protein
MDALGTSESALLGLFVLEAYGVHFQTFPLPMLLVMPQTE